MQSGLEANVSEELVLGRISWALGQATELGSEGATRQTPEWWAASSYIYLYRIQTAQIAIYYDRDGQHHIG